MVELSGSKVHKIKRLLFLRDVFVISISAFGGPEMHLALFSKRLVEKRKYLSQADLLELYSLAQMLPGPSSTQTITSMGYRFGGATLALLTLIIWVLPAFCLMTLFGMVFASQLVDSHSLLHTFRFIQPLAVAFIMVAGWKMARQVINSRLSMYLMVFAFVMAALMRHPLEKYFKTPWIFPIVLLIGGLVSYLYNRREVIEDRRPIPVKIKWRYLVVFLLIFAGSAIALRITQDRSLSIFQNTYQFGTIVFGGGNVLIPMLFDQFVQSKHFLSADEFLTGIGLNQAVPGPIFTIATYIGGLTMRDYGLMGQLYGSLLGTVGIFLPGALMIFFMYPLWDSIKNRKVIRRSLEGIIAASSGLVLAAGYLLFLPVAFRWKEPNNFFYTNLAEENFIHWGDMGLVLLLVILLFKIKLPSPVWVVAAILAGLLIP
ncbi:MAG: chromate efflux transporter [Flavobacteriales bacterium]|nr:chromate efflux transporter [Flavobacteriales bacterium]